MVDVFIKYNLDTFNFVKLVEDIYHTKLEDTHELLISSYNIPDGVNGLGKDTHSHLHKIFYDKLNSGWVEIKDLYEKFIDEVVSVYLGDDLFLYQSFPTFRIHYVGNRAITTWHKDSDENHRHPDGEINFWLPLTKTFGTNTMWVETKPGMKDYHPIETDPGYMLVFDGNKCSHGNKVNIENKTRVSLDFRILPLKNYNPKYPYKTATKGMKYIIGDYYKLYDKKGVYDGLIHNNLLTNSLLFGDNILLDRIMTENNFNNPWQVVELFEKTIAQYAGSKYAVTVDNCTNALFLCMKYLHIETGCNITIPKNTYCSVPCSIINAGGHVNFEDQEWKGSYQLKPYPIYDGAVRFRKNMYSDLYETLRKENNALHTQNILYCLSFHRRKPLAIGKGGMILTNNKKSYEWFKIARYEGRNTSIMYKDDVLTSIGWNMYMTPEQAAKGLTIFKTLGDYNMDVGSSKTYKDLSKYDIYHTF